MHLNHQHSAKSSRQKHKLCTFACQSGRDSKMVVWWGRRVDKVEVVINFELPSHPVPSVPCAGRWFSVPMPVLAFLNRAAPGLLDGFTGGWTDWGCGASGLSESARIRPGLYKIYILGESRSTAVQTSSLHTCLKRNAQVAYPRRRRGLPACTAWQCHCTFKIRNRMRESIARYLRGSFDVIG